MMMTLSSSRYGMAPALATLLAFSSLAVARGTSGVWEAEQGLYFLVGDVGASCTEACSKSGFTCTYDSLAAGADYGTDQQIAATIAELGGECKQVKGNKRSGSFPLIDGRNFCFGKGLERKNYNCNAVSQRTTSPPRRICSCFSGSSRVPEGYSLSWRDDFNGNELDTTTWSRGLVYDEDPSLHVKWDVENGGGPNRLNNNYDGYILDQDSYIENGMLTLANTEHPTPFEGTAPPDTYSYSSGFVNSLRKRYFNGSNKGVYLEIGAIFPVGLKVWPAIWLVGEDVGWPPEIDVWEYFGKFFETPAEDEMHLRLIWGDGAKSSERTFERLKGFSSNYAGYRILGFEWTDQKLSWYIDGELVWTALKSDPPDPIDPTTENTLDKYWYDQDMFLIINNGLLAAVPAEIDGVPTTSFPNFLQVNYVALYEAPGEELADLYEPEEGLFIVLGSPGDSCTNACAGVGLQCTVDSLRMGNVYSTSEHLLDTSEAIGAGSCEGGVHPVKDWIQNPMISTENYCYPITGSERTNYNCDQTSPLLVNGELASQRICSCVAEEVAGA